MTDQTKPTTTPPPPSIDSEPVGIVPAAASEPDAATAPGAAPDPESPPRPPVQKPGEVGGRDGPEPTRYGDWEVNGRCTDF